MLFPFNIFAHDLSLQRRMDACELLEFNALNAEEVERIELGLLKYDIMWWINRLSYVGMWVVVYKGRMVDRARLHGISIINSIAVFSISYQLLIAGDVMAGSLLWEEYKYVYYKYEPQIREQKISRYFRFVHD